MHVLALALLSLAATLTVDETPARPGERGFKPADESVSRRTPPAFSWRPQKRAATYDLEIRRGDEVAHRESGITLSVCCPPVALPAGEYSWRFRFRDTGGATSSWSTARRFTIPADAVEFPLPTREEILSRVPKEHPRLFLRPEDIPRIRKLVGGPERKRFDKLIAQCERLVREPPPAAEPPKYGKGVKSRSEEWRKIWWGNRTYTIRLLDGAATLGFCRRIGGNELYGLMAKKLLLAAARWDPHGSTGYRYNDEAGMPYAYHFSRTYTFVQDLLSEKEREICRAVMRARGREMYRHLSNFHLWRPYGSHANRAWHFLGEVAIAFRGEIPEADDWLWFAVNVFACVYPVWSDDDGGWHEGSNYWSSYVGRFTWWADVMKAAVGLDAYRLPYFSQVGYYAMYLMPPGTTGGGFGDLCARKRSSHLTPLMTVLAAQSGNPHWQWYVEANGGPRRGNHYIDLLRGGLPKVEAKKPDDLPTSRAFRGIGQAVLNSTLETAGPNVSVIFKSSPFGTVSHGYESQNAFLLYAGGERLLIRTGRRDMYGSKHHRLWMWQTKSVNSITVNGKGQRARSTGARGRISDFVTGDRWDYVEGEAGGAYDDNVTRFTRGIVFLKPGLIVIHDRLETARPSTFEWHLHAPTPFRRPSPRTFQVESGKARCRIRFLTPGDLEFSVTDKFDPPPRPRIKLTEYHLTASTVERATKARFVTVIGVGDRRAEADQARLRGDELRVGRARVLLPERGRPTVTFD